MNYTPEKQKALKTLLIRHNQSLSTNLAHLFEVVEITRELGNKGFLSREQIAAIDKLYLTHNFLKTEQRIVTSLVEDLSKQQTSDDKVFVD